MSEITRADSDHLIAELNALLGSVTLPQAPRNEEDVSAVPGPFPYGQARGAASSAPAPAPIVLTPPPIVLTPLPPPISLQPAPVEPPAPQAQPSTPVLAPAALKKVLVVDDNDDYREVVRYLLKQNSFEVVTASDGAQGLRLALDETPDLVLVDFEMPEMNGYEMIQALRGHYETRKVPIIMFTGAPNRKHLKALRMDICDFLEKPVSNVKLLNAVVKALNRGGDQTLNVAESRPQAPADAQPAGAQPSAPQIQEAQEEESGKTLDEWGAEDLQVDAEPEAKEEQQVSLEKLANDSPLISRVNKIIMCATEMGASDIHIEPQEKQINVRVRVNGSLQLLCTLPISMVAKLSARIKIMSNLVITERRRPQDGQIRATIKGKKVEFRVSTLPSLYGEKIVMRVLGGGKIAKSIKEAGFSSRDLACVERALQTPHGLILVTGPTGSGKTTTLYKMIGALNTPDTNIMTAEDPVEYELPGINQVHVKPAIGLTFEAVLRSFLRQDPDVMLIGEIRDLETADIAVKASITGHLVFSTLHTNSASATVTRLTHMGVAPFLVAASVKLVVAQRLIKRLCPDCKVPAPLSDEDKQTLTPAEVSRFRELYRGLGCNSCHQTGFQGRKPLFEVMPLRTPEMRQRILASSSVDQINDLAVQEGMTTLRQAALGAVSEGEVSLPEALKIILTE